MISKPDFYIGGAWTPPLSAHHHAVINPATEAPVGRISLGSAEDVDQAVQAARKAFATYRLTSIEDRLALLDRIIQAFRDRRDELAAVLSAEMGAPMRLATGAQVPSGIAHFREVRSVLASYAFEEPIGRSLLRREPIGVCGLITPWNWPLNQIACKVAPALAAGCTMVLKPSELAPLNASLLAEILHEAGVPAGVFNLVHGDGPTVGDAIASHPDIDMVSFTGSTRAGILVAKSAADTVKRVTQELGGKSANIILADADLAKAVTAGTRACFTNSGQSCNAPTRMLVPRALMADALGVARAAAEKTVVGDPSDETVHMGPVVGRAQFERVQQRIVQGMDEGAELIAGGPGRPDGLETGWFVQPTVFGNVRNDMTVAREEIFGPVLCVLAYDSEADAIAIANDTPYGLSAYVSSGSAERASEIARELRAGQVHINNAPVDHAAPFGGYRHSGNGREWGRLGFEEFLEVKAVMQ